MNGKRNVMLAAFLILIGVFGLVLARSQNKAVVAAVSPQPRDQTLPPALEAAVVPSPTAVITSAPIASTPIAKVETTNIVKSDTGQRVGYTALDGDTLSQVAVGLFGSDTKENRDQIIAANPSLQANPDRLLIGTTYFRNPQVNSTAIPVAPAATATAAVIPEPQLANQVAQPDAAATVHPTPDRVLKYTAKPGDSVSVLAAGLLGEDSKTNRDAIIGQNQSLQNDPDRVLTGKTYTIPAGDGLSAAPVSAAANVSAATTQPDADQVVQAGEGRQLRYTAAAGDNVSKLALALLGDDTQANRDAIINNNPSLKSNPDLVVAGQTYWIQAPDAPVTK